jgi:hypothetical protein
MLANCNPSFWDSQLFAAIIGAASAIIVFAAGAAWKDWKEKKTKLEKYLVTLTFSVDEVSFYKERLDQLSEELGKLAATLGTAGSVRVIIPSYSLYPKFLERSKLELAKFHRNAALVKKVSRTHFELCHIAERLSELKKTFADGSTNSAFTRSNVEGFKSLIDDDAPGFVACGEALAAEAEKVRRELSNLEALSP